MCLCTQKSRAQNPFKILERAEYCYSKGKVERALSMLKKVEACSYCTCGDCFHQVNNQSNRLRYRIYSALGENQAARKALEAIDVMEGGSKEIDSLWILCYQAEFGVEFLATTIDSALEQLKLVCDEDEADCFVELPLDTTITIQFSLTLEEALFCIVRKEQATVKEKWRKNFRTSSLYQLIKNKEI